MPEQSNNNTTQDKQAQNENENLTQTQKDQLQKQQKQQQKQQQTKQQRQSQKKPEEAKEKEEDEGEDVEEQALLMEQKRKKQRRNLLLNSYFEYIIVAVIIFILMLGYLLILKPEYKNAISEFRQSLSGEARVYKQQQRKLKSLEKLIDTYKDISPAKIERINELLPSDYPKEKLFIELGHVIPDNGFELGALELYKESELKQRARENQVQQEDKPDMIKNLPEGVGYIQGEMSVGVVDYNGIKKLLEVLERNLKIVDIYSINFSPTKAQLSLKFYTYYLK